jgi:hypothetical protein
VLKSYFDGGNEADRSQYEHLTLGGICGTEAEWIRFDKAWRRVLTKHHTRWLHTTDAVGRKNIYSGWTVPTVDAFIDDCVTVIEQHTAISRVRRGLRPITATIILKDFQRALDKVPNLGTPENTCVISCVDTAFAFGTYIGCKKFQLFFDQG